MMLEGKRLYQFMAVVPNAVLLILLAYRFEGVSSGASLWTGIIITAAAIVPLLLLGGYMAATGRGQSLVAGFNTMSAERKAAYDGRLVARATGWVVIDISLPLLIGMLAVFLFRDIWVFWASFLLVMVLTVVLLVYMNTGGRYLRDPRVRPERLPGMSRRGKLAVAAVLIVVTAVTVGGVYALMQYGSVDAELGEERLKVDAPSLHVSVRYDDIVSVELIPDMDTGFRTMGFGGSHIRSGLFSNGLFGDYDLASNTGVALHIAVHSDRARVLAFNLATYEDTESFYLELLDRLPV